MDKVRLLVLKQKMQDLLIEENELYQEQARIITAKRRVRREKRQCSEEIEQLRKHISSSL